MKYLILSLVIFLSACATTPEIVKPEQVVIKEVSYVIRIPPEVLLIMPEQVPKIDVDTAKQSTIANWIIDTNERTKMLENKLIEIGKFFKSEQDKLNKQAAEDNLKNKKDSNEAQSAAVLDSISVPKK